MDRQTKSKLRLYKLQTTLATTNNNITQNTDDHRESAFLFQRLSFLIQRYNAAAVLATFTHTTPEDEM